MLFSLTSRHIGGARPSSTLTIAVERPLRHEIASSTLMTGLFGGMGIGKPIAPLAAPRVAADTRPRKVAAGRLEEILVNCARLSCDVLAQPVRRGFAASRLWRRAARSLLASHRAVYDLKLAQYARQEADERGAAAAFSTISRAARARATRCNSGRCRELDSGEGKVSLSDLRATTWEEGSGEAVALPFAELPRRALRDAVDGQAERREQRHGVKLTQPYDKSFDYSVEVVFPTEHVRRIIAAAREGKTVLRGCGLRRLRERREDLRHAHRHRQRDRAGRARAEATLPASRHSRWSLTRWPVTISYFDKEQGEAVSNCRSTPSPSSSTRTACRARCCSTTAISSSAAR